MMKKIVAAVLLVSMTVGVLTGCAGKGSDSSGGKGGSGKSDSSSGKVTINYYAWSEGDYLQDIIDAYNGQSTVAEVKMTQVSSSDYDDKLRTMLAGKNDIDVFNLRSGAMVSDLATSGNLADISQYIQDNSLDVSVYGTGFADTQIENKFYSLPYRASAYGLFYNKKIFDEKNMDYPDNLTWDDYAKLALELVEGEGTDKFYGSYIPDWNTCTYEMLQKGSNLADDDLNPLQIWMERLNQFYNIDNSHLSYTDMVSAGTDPINFFVTGNCAMYPGGEWTISDILAMLKNDPKLEETFELGIAMVPQVSGADELITIGGVSTFACLNTASEKQEAAYDFMQYLAGKEAAKIVAGYGAIPAYIDDDITKIFEETIGVDGVSNMLDLNKISEALFIPKYTDITNMYKEELELYLIGEQSIEETMGHFEERRAEISK